jgi:hypothetical protein
VNGFDAKAPRCRTAQPQNGKGLWELRARLVISYAIVASSTALTQRRRGAKLNSRKTARVDSRVLRCQKQEVL